MITALIFLVMLTIIGVAAARMSSLEERMAGNMRDRDVALRAAEMCLREAERHIMTADSQCNPPLNLNTLVNCGAVPGLPTPSRYRIFPCQIDLSGSGVNYTITVDAWGAKPGTLVVLQEVLVARD